MPKSKNIKKSYLRAVRYGAVGQFKGTRMTVVLGPAVGDMYMGSKTNGTGIATIMNKLKAKNPRKWVAGHLLAGELGGSGTASENLTPLTQNANKRMSSKYELTVKRWTVQCRQYMNLNERNWDEDDCLGVYYRVTTSVNKMSATAPYDKVASGVKITAEVRLYHRGRMVPLPAHIKAYFGTTRIRGPIANLMTDLV